LKGFLQPLHEADLFFRHLVPDRFFRKDQIGLTQSAVERGGLILGGELLEDRPVEAFHGSLDHGEVGGSEDRGEILFRTGRLLFGPKPEEPQRRADDLTDEPPGGGQQIVLTEVLPDFTLDVGSAFRCETFFLPGEQVLTGSLGKRLELLQPL